MQLAGGVEASTVQKGIFFYDGERVGVVANPEKATERFGFIDSLKQLRHKFLELVAKIGINTEIIVLYAKWVIAAPAFVLFILIVMLLRPRKKLSPLKPKTPVSIPNKKTPDAPLATQSAKKPIVRLDESTSDTGRILQFFLRLFKFQEKLEPDAESEFELTEHRNYCPHDTYEMRVAFKKDWVTRRMSMGLLGQGGGSRSKCFYVIYDSHLVIKIPAEPMTDFEVYNRQIAAEGRIVDRLAPRLCIVPRVTVILKAIYDFGIPGISDDELEKRYVELLREKPPYQEYLKIGGSFAFFMDLARYFFLSSTLEEIHHDTGRMIDEVLAYPDLLWDHNSFIGRYGEEAGSVCHDLQDAYRECEIQLRQLIDDVVTDRDVPHYLYKQWFLHHLAGEHILAENFDLPIKVIDHANKIIGVVLQSCQEQIEVFRNGITIYKQGVRFSRHVRQLENLASNTLDLLAWIIKNDLVLRDLKPENLFVAGEPDDYPMFLNDRSQFTIGLIDVETAVILEKDGNGRIPQPQLAGTPLYATPTHLLSNAILNEIYGDVRTTLQLQDWHATMAIIYKLLTGGNLFTITAHAFPEIVNEIKIIDPTGTDLEEQIININRLYWNSAQAEFQDAMHAHKAVFSKVSIVVPEHLAPEIQYIMVLDIEQSQQTIDALIDGQSFFNSPQKVTFLKEASTKKIGQMKNRLIQERDSGSGLDPNRGDALIFFKHLERLKNDIGRKESAMATLGTPYPTMAADLLLEAMFQRVFQHMYPSHWPALTPSKYRSTAYMAMDITTYQATL